MGDDYPAILRQMRNIRCSGKPILFLEKYTGLGATFDQMVEISRRAGIEVVTLAPVKEVMEADDAE